MIICVTGTPGTGKTTLSKEISKKLGFIYIDGNNIIKKYSLSEGYDSKRKCIIVDEKKFSKAVLKECKDRTKNYVIDSHLSHFLPKKKVFLCIVCTSNLKVLKNRLKKRKYQKNKIKDNLEAEIFEICKINALENNHNVLCLDMSKKRYLSKNINKLRKILNLCNFNILN